MAVKTITIDDYTGEEIPDNENKPDPVYLELQGKRYQLDLSEESIAEFKKALGKFWDNVTESKKPATKSASKRSSSTKTSDSGASTEYLDRLTKLAFKREQLVALSGDLVELKLIDKPLGMRGRISEATAVALIQRIESEKIKKQDPSVFADNPTVIAAKDSLKSAVNKAKATQATKKG